MPAHPKIQSGNADACDWPGYLTQMSDFIKSDSGSGNLNKVLRLADALQTTLDIRKLIEIYSREINGFVVHDSISFENRPLKLDLSSGVAAMHSCSYQLVVAAQSLGRLTLTRKKKFTADEKTMLEYLLCGLVYPLRNAISYRLAQMAAVTDPLTGINNLSAMNKMLLREIELARRHDTPLSLICMDIDHIASINERYDQGAGDQVIKAVASAIEKSIRSCDILFYTGGGGFSVILNNARREGARLLGKRIHAAVCGLDCQYEDHPIDISISLGVSCLAAGDNHESLLENAALALAMAKSDGRDCVRYYPEGNEAG